MSGSEIVDTEGEKKKTKKHTGSVQPPLDGQLSAWIERQFRGGESPSSIDAYPLYRGRDKEERCYHYDIKGDETVGAERAVELANEIYSDCQLHCDNLPRIRGEGSKTYQVSVIDGNRGGLAQPVGTHLMKLVQRVFSHSPSEDTNNDDLSSEDGDTLTARKMILEVHKENAGRQERTQSGMLVAVGETMLLLKESLKDAFVQNRELHGDIRGMMGEFRELLKAEGQRRVEEKAVAIDAENAAVEREIKRASMTKENMWTDVQRAAMLEGVKVLGALFPGFGQLFSALVSGKPIPPPPQLPGTGGVPPTQPQLPAPAQTQAAALTTVSEEKKLVDRFIEAAENYKIDETHTAAEKLFGKDDDSGKPVEAGVFTREQVAILTGVHMGSLSIDALDAVLQDSGKPEAIQGIQMMKAIAYATPEMIQDIARFMELRKTAREKGSH